MQELISFEREVTQRFMLSGMNTSLIPVWTMLFVGLAIGLVMHHVVDALQVHT